MPTVFHSLALYIETKTASWRDSPLLQRPRMLLLTVLHQEVWPWEKMVKVIFSDMNIFYSAYNAVI